ncbi:hypothetical protein D9M72_316870 [compost metagenome]
MSPIGMPTAKPSSTETTTRVMKGLSLKRAISTTSAITAISAYTKSVVPVTAPILSPCVKKRPLVAA